MWGYIYEKLKMHSFCYLSQTIDFIWGFSCGWKSRKLGLFYAKIHICSYIFIEHENRENRGMASISIHILILFYYIKWKLSLVFRFLIRYRAVIYFFMDIHWKFSCFPLYEYKYSIWYAILEIHWSFQVYLHKNWREQFY